MEIISKPLRLRAVLDDARRQRRRVALVPTMGALHAGHLSLVRLARERADHVVVSVFVNPLQFAPGEDFERYPRDLARDADLLAAEDVDCAFAPDPSEMYRNGHRTHVEVEGISDILIGERRPGHFRGVATVVLKLFNLVRPGLAVFGAKDAQQVVIVQRMVKDLDLDVEVLVAPTVREADGLALSSRNAYLAPDARRAAPVLYKSLEEAVRRVHAGERSPARIEEAMLAVLAQEPLASVNHAKVVDARDLSDLKRIAGAALVLVSADVGPQGGPLTTLIDSVRIEVAEEA